MLGNRKTAGSQSQGCVDGLEVRRWDVGDVGRNATLPQRLPHAIAVGHQHDVVAPGVRAARPDHRRADRRTQNANQNKVVFDVRPTASKPEIKRAIEQVYDVKVVRVNTLHTKRGKRAIIKLSEADNAEDIYTRLGQM